MLQFGVIGHKGRMGQALEAAIRDAGHVLHVGVDAGGNIGPFAAQCDVLVDFSAPDALGANLGAAKVAGKPVVVGTTGLGEEHFVMLAEAARAVPVLQSGNFSLGVTLMAHLVREAAARLGPDWDIEVLETHHRRKLDAPSGTALMLAEAAAQGRGAALSDLRSAPYDGADAARKRGAIGFAVRRSGGVIGEHEVTFGSDMEVLSLSHTALDRSVFAHGAIKAAEWAVTMPPGLYGMDDVLGV